MTHDDPAAPPPEACPRCGGTGAVELRGRWSQPLRAFLGNGRTVPCDACGGTGTASRKVGEDCLP